MDYELAEQLKDAGFASRLVASIGFSPRPKSISINDLLYDLPTLTELMEVCGEDLLIATALQPV